jgi:hypothetical protein
MITKKINRPFYLSVLLLMISAISYGQALKTFSGQFPNGTSQPGEANYKYYEDPKTREYIKQGAFNYSIIGKDDLKGLNQTISGNYEKGLKQGTWTYKLIMNDYFLGYYHATGTITLISNYKNGLADGNWTYNTKNKTRKYNNYTGWGEYRPEEVVKASMNFSNGKLVGNVNIDHLGIFKANGSYDQNSYSVGTWKLSLLDKNQTYEITYKNKFMTDFIGRNGSGQILEGSTSLNPELNAERNQKYLDLRGKSPEELEIAGYDLDTVCSGNVPTKYIQPYFEYMMSPDWFLYKYIKGDLTYNYNSLHGGCNIVVEKVDYTTLDNIRVYGQAEEFFNSGLYIDAFNSYIDVETYIRQYTGYRYKKIDLKRLDKKFQISFDKADSLSKTLMTYKEAYSLSETLMNKEEVTQITSSFESKNMDYYRYYKQGAINSLYDYKSFDVFKERNTCNESTTYFNPNRRTKENTEGPTSGVKYVNCNRDSVINRLAVKMDERLEEIRNLLLISQQFEAKTKQIEELNLTIETKLLYATYSAVMNEFKEKYTARNFNEDRSIDEYMNFITIVNLSLDKIIASYSVKKDIDKALKKAVSLKAKNELLFPFFPFRSDGYLDQYKFDGFLQDKG